MRPLEGFTVVALEQVIAGPFATRQLAELGARVIKIERPGGGDPARAYDRTVKGLSSHFVWVNRSKESLALDLKHPAAKEILEKLLARADVFLQNLAPGAAERLGLGAVELRARHPRLVWCGISGYGPAGPYADKKAYDLLVQCEAGLLSVTGTPESPAKAGIPAADIAAGMYAFSSILAALVRRERSGEGATIDVTMLEALGEWMLRNATLADDPRFGSGPARQQNREAMHGEIERVFAALSTDEVVARLDAAEIANARLNDMAQFWHHPQLQARGRWAVVGSPAGELDALKPPFNLDGMEPKMEAVPDVGQHSRAVLAELGYSDAEIARLAAGGAI